ncbi:SDR family NAD(P)-dependent oxidoreductase [Shewanella schlegeliana]|uniref:SDR family NAD(P)-dependent oxidoreductase n=1 Tax=Shewanella schlegeliana TaxID=190308 RepID=A0ABS1T276_9GAMM|nr:SDR family NAD(P)-dependent oxidoreductase [Shewanella schlegeliana]MBL4914911.1 SDR family NAD(P)-dependent oxidoreductase [Shewanella schlegeliana]MCL1110398.1 SDR family NAD(P)-dependent oxidoreductase [Shewanella schlegeliana]GIU27841.1 short-chain dehydrogenase [Shewanella schlegeliana]
MILITGASSGLGAALAKLYGKESPICISGRNSDRLQLVATDVGQPCQTQVTDLSDADAVAALFNSLTTTPSLIIHCAGSGYFGPIETQSPEAIKDLLNNNVTSAIFLLREAVRRYKDQSVTMVMVMSTAALVPKAEESTYCAAKWAVKALIESVRLELKSSPMKLIAVYPGGMVTDFWPTSGKEANTNSFMSADEAAGMLKQALQSTEHGYISDLTIARG